MRGISRGSGVAGSVRTLAMSAECDRMFSSTKKLIGPERNCLLNRSSKHLSLMPRPLFNSGGTAHHRGAPTIG